MRYCSDNVRKRRKKEQVQFVARPRLPFWGHFGFCRRCGIAGGERVPLAPLGWYSIQHPCILIHTIQNENLYILIHTIQHNTHTSSYIQYNMTPLHPHTYDAIQHPYILIITIQNNTNTSSYIQFNTTSIHPHTYNTIRHIYILIHTKQYNTTPKHPHTYNTIQQPYILIHTIQYNIHTSPYIQYNSKTHTSPNIEYNTTPIHPHTYNTIQHPSIHPFGPSLNNV